MKDNFLPVLAIVVIGGVVIYLISRPNPIVAPPPAVAPPQQQCGASYAGTGVSVPCSLVGQGIKDVYNKAASVLQSTGVTSTVKTGTQGFSAVDVVIAPVAINHALYNYAKAGYDKLTSWL
jgi:hypothetical protein